MFCCITTKLVFKQLTILNLFVGVLYVVCVMRIISKDMVEEVQLSLFQFVWFFFRGQVVLCSSWGSVWRQWLISSLPLLLWMMWAASGVSWGRRDVRSSFIFPLQAQFISFGTTNNVLNEGYGWLVMCQFISVGMKSAYSHIFSQKLTPFTFFLNIIFSK